MRTGGLLLPLCCDRYRAQGGPGSRSDDSVGLETVTLLERSDLPVDARPEIAIDPAVPAQVMPVGDQALLEEPYVVSFGTPYQRRASSRR